MILSKKTSQTFCGTGYSYACLLLNDICITLSTSCHHIIVATVGFKINNLSMLLYQAIMFDPWENSYK